MIVTNVPKERLKDEDIIKEYKQQWNVEEKFKVLKQPTILGPIWLQNKQRINGLIFVLLLSVLVVMFITYRMNKSLNGNDELFKEKDF